MPNLNQNVMLNGKILAAGKSVSAASVKKYGLGSHLFDSKQTAESSGVDKAEASDEGDQENQEN